MLLGGVSQMPPKCQKPPQWVMKQKKKAQRLFQI
ncbi:hypothetical protein N220_05490 [Mannheimia haemolytica USMARC_2286]|nr:hypothetical protein N220_05490 [Mannheimia haemolytica USMARC_2286]